MSKRITQKNFVSEMNKISKIEKQRRIFLYKERRLEFMSAIERFKKASN